MYRKMVMVLMVAAVGMLVFDRLTLQAASSQTTKAKSYDADQTRPKGKATQTQTKTTVKKASKPPRPSASTQQTPKAATPKTVRATSYDADQIRPKSKSGPGQNQKTTSSGSRSGGDLGSWGQAMGDASDAQSEYSQAQAMTNSVAGGGGTFQNTKRHK